MTKARVISEKGTSPEKMRQVDWPMGQPVAYFGDWWLMCVDPSNCRQYHPPLSRSRRFWVLTVDSTSPSSLSNSDFPFSFLKSWIWPFASPTEPVISTQLISSVLSHSGSSVTWVFGPLLIRDSQRTQRLVKATSNGFTLHNSENSLCIMFVHYYSCFFLISLAHGLF